MVLIFFVIAIILLVVLCKPPSDRWYVPAKLALSAMFVGFAIFCGIFLAPTKGYYFLGFLLCFTGDAALGYYRLNRKKLCFLLGLSAFLFAHLFFLLALCAQSSFRLLDLMFPIFCLGITGVLLRLPQVNSKGMDWAILGYTFFVSFLFSKSIQLLFVAGQPFQYFFFFGSGLFFASDVLLFFLYFYSKAPAWLHPMNLICYYSGMFILAGSFLFVL